MDNHHDSNRPFLLLMLALGVLMLLVVCTFMVWVWVLQPQQQARQAEADAAISATNEAILVSQRATATVQAATPVPTSPGTMVLDCPRCDVLQFGYTLQSERCTTWDCLFIRDTEPNHPVGVVTLAGYYTSREGYYTELFGTPGPVTCDAFVITAGSAQLIRAYLNLLDEGNSVNARNALNQPIINLDLSTLTEAEAARILASTPENPLQLVVLIFSPSYTTVPPCFSPVEVLRVR